MTWNLPFVDTFALIVYLVAMAAIGIYFAARNNTTEEFFLGNRAFSGWVVGLSMLATSISSITFLAFPETAFKGNWKELVNNLMLPIVAVIGIVWFVPIFRKTGHTSAFEYLEARFGIWPRLYGVVCFLLYHCFRMGLILMLVAIMLGPITGADIPTLIAILGVFVAAYTVMGGIDAVIWTDVVQAFVLWGGGLLCLILMLFEIPGGAWTVLELGQTHQKFSLGSFHVSASEKTFWTFATLGILHFASMYCSDQTFVQRYAVAKSLSDARWATGLYSLLAVPTWLLFFFIGTSLWVYYQHSPDPQVAAMIANEQTSQIFPHFILTKLPTGMAGVLIAGVLAAAMSTLDSSMNSIATVLTVDVLRPYLMPGRSDQFYLRFAKWATLGAALVMIASGLWLNTLSRETANDLSWVMTSLLSGCILGVFLIGFFTTTVGNKAVCFGLLVAIAVNLFLVVNRMNLFPFNWRLNIQDYWTLVIVNGTFVVASLFAQLSLPQNNRTLTNLTVWTFSPDAEPMSGSDKAPSEPDHST